MLWLQPFCFLGIQIFVRNQLYNRHSRKLKACLLFRVVTWLQTQSIKPQPLCADECNRKKTGFFDEGNGSKAVEGGALEPLLDKSFNSYALKVIIEPEYCQNLLPDKSNPICILSWF